MISIIIPVYNVELYLDQCIQSVLNQNYQDFECVLIDDGSKDKSSGICDYWQERDNRIKVVHQDNSGVSTARNKGLSLAKGEYITFIDSDDWVDENYLADLIEGIKEDIDLVVTGLFYNYPQKMIISSPTEQILELTPFYTEEFVELNRHYFLYGPVAKLYRSSIIKSEKIMFNSELSYGEDLVFNFQYLSYINKIKSLAKVNYHYRKENNVGLSYNINPEIFNITYNQWHVIKSLYEKNGMWNNISENLLYTRLWGLIYDGIFLFSKSQNLEREYIKRILDIKEITYLKEWKQSFECSYWIKLLILNRCYNLFYIFFKLKILK